MRVARRTTNVEVAQAMGISGFEQHKMKLIDTNKIIAKIMEDDLGKEDILTSWSDVSFNGLNAIEVKDQGIFSFNEYSFEQMCNRLNVPAAYLKKCPFVGKAGRQEQLEYWRDQTDDREIMLRVKRFDDASSEESNGALRAVLSRSYEPIDNLQLFQWTESAIERQAGNLGIIYANVGQLSTHFRMCFADPIDIGTPGNPDPHFFGIHVADSEVGMRGFTMDYMLFRVACTNGMIVEVEGDKLLSHRHIHVDKVSLGREFQDAITVALDHRETLLDTVAATHSKVIADPHSAIRRLVKHYKGSKEFTDAVISAYELEPPAVGERPTKYHIIQAMTRAARKMPIDDRMHIEGIAGKVLLEAA